MRAVCTLHDAPEGLDGELATALAAIVVKYAGSSSSSSPIWARRRSTAATPSSGSSSRIDLVAGQLGMSAAGNPNAFSPSLDIPAADLARSMPLDGTGTVALDIHAFSYLQTAPMINQRVINETAAHLAYLESPR